MKAMLVLENGSVFEGPSIGVGGEKAGRVVLDTAVVGYQEMISDPANAGKILIPTYPLIGNYGVAEKFYESSKCWINGLAIREESRIYSNWQAKGPFGEWLKKEGILAASGIDTRTLAVEIRDRGEIFGIISTETSDKALLLEKLAKYKDAPERDFISRISVKRITDLSHSGSGPRIAVLDMGILNSFLRQLEALRCRVTLLPYDTDAAKITALKPDGLILASGPEEDIAMPLIAKTVKALLGKIPMMGISAGHEIIGLALGAKIKAMKVGHHGVNYPVKGEDSYKGEITVQNHSLVVDEGSLKTKREVSITLRNINDGTIEEMESRPLKFISAQYYPVSPGFGEVNSLFKRFLKMMRPARSSKEVAYAKT
jgi:carbamoyl-phosphate synthase small subunit